MIRIRTFLVPRRISDINVNPTAVSLKVRCVKFGLTYDFTFAKVLNAVL